MNAIAIDADRIATPKVVSRKSTLKVLHVIPGVAPRYGGPSTVIFSMVRALNGLGNVRAEIATTDADGADGRIALQDLPADLPIHLFRKTWSERWKVSLGLRNWVRAHAAEFDLVHIHALWSFATATAARAAGQSDVPYVLRPAGMLSGYSWGHRSWSKRAYWRLVEQRTLLRAAAVHATSEEEASEVRAVRPDARVFVIPNGVDEEAFTQQRDVAGLRRVCGPMGGGRPIVLFLSRIHPKKGIVDRLLPAVAAMRSDCLLAIVGAVDPHAPGHLAEVEAAVDRLGLRERVVLLGPVLGEARWSLFDGADVFVLLSHSENFGIVVAEAMARGCPVVVTDAVQSSSHVTNAGAGEVVSGNVEEVAAALDRVLSSRELQLAYGTAGRAYASEHFRWDRIARQVRQMYDECLAGEDDSNYE